jgi:hypothetical protein
MPARAVANVHTEHFLGKHSTGRNAGADPLRLFGATERRSARRYPLTFRVRYRMSVDGAIWEREAWTRDVSTQGVRLQPSEELREGMRIVVFLDWPIPDQAGAPMNLVATGRVLRRDQWGIGVRFDQRPFFVHRVANDSSLQFFVPRGRVM